jgi:hypothetical protein
MIIQQRNQFKRELVKYQPKFKINFFDSPNNGKYVFDLLNDGFAYFADESVEWIGDGDEIDADFFNGEVTSEKKGRHESLIIILKYKTPVNSSGYFKVTGYDIMNKQLTFKSPQIIFKDGEIENHLKLSYQYLK